MTYDNAVHMIFVFMWEVSQIKPGQLNKRDFVGPRICTVFKDRVSNSCDYVRISHLGSIEAGPRYIRTSISAQKNSSFRLPYQRPSSSADCARELFKGSNGSASLVDSTRKKIFWLGDADFLWLTS